MHETRKSTANIPATSDLWDDLGKGKGGTVHYVPVEQEEVSIAFGYSILDSDVCAILNRIALEFDKGLMDGWKVGVRAQGI